MAKKPVRPKGAVDQTNQRSLRVHRDALREGRLARGTGILLRHESERTTGESPAIVLKDLAYKELCEIGEKFLAYKWVAASVIDTSAPPSPDCQGRSCAGRPCSEPCVCDPATLRCVKISIE